MDLSLSIPLDKIASRIYGKLSLAEQKEQVELLYNSTWKLHYSIVRLSCLICEFEDRINLLIEKKLTEDELKKVLDYVLLFFPLQNIDELLHDTCSLCAVYLLRLNLQTLAFRQHIWMLNRISLSLKEEQDANLLSEFITLLQFLNIDSLMIALKGIHEETQRIIDTIYKSEPLKNSELDKEDAMLIESVMQDARSRVTSSRNQRKIYNDQRISVDKYLDSLKKLVELEKEKKDKEKENL